MSRRTALLGALALVALAVVGVLWFVGRETPEAVDIDRAVADAAAAPSAGASEGDGSADVAAGPVDVVGTWVVDTDAVAFDAATGAGSWVGYRIDEELSGIGAYTAVGRSPRVEGGIAIEAGRVVSAEVRADLQGLVSDNANRDGRVRPIFADRPVVFVLAEPIVFGDVPEDGQRITATAQGTLRIGDVERAIDVELSADVAGERLVVTGSTIVTLADFDVAVPSAPVVLSVSDEATVELQLYLRKG